MKPQVNTDRLVCGPKGLRLDAKAAYRDGQAMLTVYGFWIDTVTSYREHTHRVVLQRVLVPSTTTKAEKRDMLRAMCDLIAIEHGIDYRLRSKL
jgi:hypothetical protein